MQPGALSLLQDYGRYGHQAIGYTEGGPMDEHAFLWANHLLGNHFNATQLEITLGQLTLYTNAPTTIALTGADLEGTLNGLPIGPWQTYAVRAGDKLSFNRPVNGLRAYLAVQGGFLVEAQRGSVSTVCRERIGGLDGTGQKLTTGDQLPFTPVANVQLTKQVPCRYRRDYLEPLVLRILECYQFEYFDPATVQQFYRSQYRISSQSDRMGYRLQGAGIHCSLDGVISEGISYGAVQIPADGQPIILLKDRQTIGGYPKIGCVMSADAAKLAQRMPGQEVTFCPGSMQEARQERLTLNRFFQVVV